MSKKNLRNNQTSISIRKTVSIPHSDSKDRARKKMTTLPTTVEPNIEILIEEEECPYCHFAKLKREGDQIVCPICGYGRKACT